MATAFSNIAMMQEFQKSGAFPRIHRDAARFAIECLEGRRILDLCCHFGLLGEQLKRRMGNAYVIGMDIDAGAIESGRSHGITIPLYAMGPTPGNLMEFLAVLAEHQIDTIVCRRGFSEVFVTNRKQPVVDAAFAQRFREALATAGIREIVAQGREPRANSMWPIPDVDAEIACLVPTYRLVAVEDQLAYLAR